MTPIKCFRVDGLEVHVEDFANIRTLICVAANIQQQAWLVSSLESYHKVKTYDWDEEIGS